MASTIKPVTTPRADELFQGWVAHFERNRRHHVELATGVDWDAAAVLDPDVRRAISRSFQRFELGEGGDGVHLLRKAARVATPAQLRALRMLVQEEQAHSALFGRGLRHLGAPSLRAHWSDGMFTTLRRALGLRTELVLFLTAESVAMPYFAALEAHGPDEVIRAIGGRIAADEVHHLRFQIDQLRRGFAPLSLPARLLVHAAWSVVAIGATAVVAVDHGAALRACGVPLRRFVPAALRSFAAASTAALWR